jgi:hypothetical protein
MKKRALMIVCVLALVGVCLLGTGYQVQASDWDDLPDSLVHAYGLTLDQVSTISQGFGSGLWLPNKIISRAMFVRMATVVYSIPPATPMVPTYNDVSPANDYFAFVEGATSAGLILGVGGGRFLPEGSISREQAVAIIAREVAVVNGLDLSQVYSATSATAVLAHFADASAVSSGLKSEMAFAVEQGIVKGDSSGRLLPKSQLTRIQAAAMLVRSGSPKVTAINPLGGPAAGGTKVTITGMGFEGVWEVGSVRFGLVDAVSYQVDSATQITAIAPPGIPGTSVQVSVTDSTGVAISIAPQPFSYSSGGPAVSSVSPGSGPSEGGNTVTISGELLVGATGVRFGSKSAQSFTVVSASQITAVAPAGVTGTSVDISVTGPYGTSVSSAGSKYCYGAPAITSVQPAAGPAAGGNSVVITGVGLFGVSDVLFGDETAESVTFSSATEIRAVAPAGPEGTTVDVRVVGPGGTSLATSATRYAYGAPLIFTVSPSMGPAGGSTVATIKGSGFTGLTGASAVRFGAKNALSYTVVSDILIRAVSPPGTAGKSVPVTVTNPAGTSPAIATFLYYK